MKKIALGIFAIALTAVSCTNSSKSKPSTTQEDSTTVVAQKEATTSSFFGTYEGTLPAADCGGIKTTLTLNNDTTYRLIREYLGKSDTPVETNGVYNMKSEDLVELITPSSGVKTYYKIQENAVVLCDSLGTVNEGELAAFYILKKK